MANKSAHQIYIKNCLFGESNIVKNSDKTRYMCSGYEKAFDGADLWYCRDDFPKNAVEGILTVGNSSLSHTDNCKNKSLVLGVRPIDQINASFGTARKNFNISFSKANTTFCLSLHCNGDNSCFPPGNKTS